MKLSKIIISTAVMAALLSFGAGSVSAKGVPSLVKMSKEVLKDKIKGAWAGQTIGCTYGGPTEFKYNGIIPEETPIYWRNNSIKWWFENSPGLYDDVYMDLTFVEVFQKHHTPSGMRTGRRATTSCTESCLLSQVTGRTIRMLTTSISR